MKEKISPLIKWTGGKFREFEHFKDKIPIFERYVEPFFGGGGVFFNLQTSKPSFINDKSQDLMRFYGQINQQNFKTELNQYAQAWQEITDLSRELWNTHRAYFVHPIGEKEPANTLSKAQLNAFLKNYNTLNSSDFSVFPAKLSEKIIENITSKKRRIDQITRKENRAFSETELFAHFETAIKSGLYLFCRDLLNINVKQAFLTEEKASANWYFVRELCYASMFRFNAKGEFNIPYGGIAYNKKNLQQKIDAIFSEATQTLFSNTKLFNLDFEDFLNRVKLEKCDFIFVDPPYDSEFSEYDQNAFTQSDQQRLANFLISCPAKWMVVIKDTDFIRSIYQAEGIFIDSFNKNYTYNVRGRNNRAVNHLVITNY